MHDLHPGDAEEARVAFGNRNHLRLNNVVVTPEDEEGFLGALKPSPQSRAMATAKQTLEPAWLWKLESVAFGVPRMRQARAAYASFIKKHCQLTILLMTGRAPQEDSAAKDSAPQI